MVSVQKEKKYTGRSFSKKKKSQKEKADGAIVVVVDVVGVKRAAAVEKKGEKNPHSYSHVVETTRLRVRACDLRVTEWTLRWG